MMPDLYEDDILFDVLRRAVEGADPIPEDAVMAARAVFELSRVDSELAQLVFDSMADAVPVGMRSGAAGGARSLCFETSALAIDVEVLDDGSVVGQVEPAAVTGGRIETTSTGTPFMVDAGGRFRTSVDEPRFRLRFELGARSVTTPWIRR
jgi:hypothetical protein